MTCNKFPITFLFNLFLCHFVGEISLFRITWRFERCGFKAFDTFTFISKSSRVTNWVFLSFYKDWMFECLVEESISSSKLELTVMKLSSVYRTTAISQVIWIVMNKLIVFGINQAKKFINVEYAMNKVDLKRVKITENNRYSCSRL